MADRTFILGVGAQKSATSWFYDQICKSPDFQIGIGKEYHVFDAIHLRKCRYFKNQALEQAAKKQAKGRNVLDPDIQRAGFIKDATSYFDYFDGLISPMSFSADVTPTYSGLPKEVYAQIREEFLKRDIHVRAVFFMREPISRLMSAANMHFDQHGEDYSRDDFFDKMNMLMNNGMDDLRSCYPQTCANLEAVFPREDIHFGFYETMFTPKEISRLANFLDMDVGLFNVSTQNKSSIAGITMSEFIWQQYRDHFEDRYAYIEQHFAREPWGKKIPGLWQKASNKLITPATETVR